MKLKNFQKSQFLILFFGISLLLSFTKVAQAQKFQISIFGGLNHVFEYGSEDDYVMNENDFPITPAHTPGNFGGAVSYLFTKKLVLELDGRYILGSKVTLVDPSDEDTVDYNTSKHFSLSLNLIYHFLKSKISPYLLIGGGIDSLANVKEKTLTTKYGYPFEVEKPKKTTNSLINFGTGIQYFITKSLGARLDVRYIVIFDDPNNISGLNFTGGAFLRF